MKRRVFSTDRARKNVAMILFLAIASIARGSLGDVRAQAAAPAGAVHGIDYAKAKEQARAVAKEWLARGIPGLTLAVAVDGKIVYAEGFGYADLEQRVPVWPTTKFRIASDSKPLTAAGLMLLVEQGKIDLDAPVQKYVPSFPDKGAKITPRMLAGHLAGIRHYDSVLEGLKIFADDPLLSPPGKEFHYSSYGFNLLSAVMEAAAGQEFLSYMRSRVFLPLGLRHTVADQTAEII